MDHFEDHARPLLEEDPTANGAEFSSLVNRYRFAEPPARPQDKSDWNLAAEQQFQINRAAMGNAPKKPEQGACGFVKAKEVLAPPNSAVKARRGGCGRGRRGRR